jgi:ribosomal protein S18 acetylase RimI-like enzyme
MPLAIVLEARENCRMNKDKRIAIRPVHGAEALRDFIRLPLRLYKNDKHWVPPLWIAERSAYKPGRNAVLDRSDHILLSAYDGARVVGRLAAYIDPLFNAHFKCASGFFGSFECEDEPAAAAALFQAAESWFAARGMDRSRGPINPVAECWGALVDGFGSSPVYMSPYNPPYYDRLLTRAGYAGVKDLLAYEADAGAGYALPERFRRFEALVAARRPGITTRMIDTRGLDRDAEHIRRILNTSVDGNWGFVPVGREEMAAIVRDLKPILDPAAIWFVEDGGIPVGCCLGFPDINMILKKIRGRLLPTGFLRLLAGVKRLRDYRLWGLAVLPEYQSLGLDVLLYIRLFDSLAARGVRLEANYILEDNLRIRNALEKLGLKAIKAYRVYEKALSAP